MTVVYHLRADNGDRRMRPFRPAIISEISSPIVKHFWKRSLYPAYLGFVVLKAKLFKCLLASVRRRWFQRRRLVKGSFWSLRNLCRYCCDSSLTSIYHGKKMMSLIYHVYSMFWKLHSESRYIFICTAECGIYIIEFSTANHFRINP